MKRSFSITLLTALIGLAPYYSSDASGQGIKSGQSPGTSMTQPLGMSGWQNDPVVIHSPELGMTGWWSEAADLTAPVLGMTGWRSDPIALTTSVLGMTGWHSEPVGVIAPMLGMTGWRGEPIAITAPMLGMTGWRSEPVRLATGQIGMTGWRSQPDKPAPPRLVCLGGQVTKLAAGSGGPGFACACPPGRTAQAARAGYQNTFQCIPTAVVPPPRIVKPAPTRVTPQPKVVCSGGSVRNNVCVCGAGYAPVKTGTTSYRCNRIAVLPPPVVAPKPVAPTRVTNPQIACAGGVVRSNRCVCPGGTTLKNGACVAATSVPLQSVSPQRVR